MLEVFLLAAITSPAQPDVEDLRPRRHSYALEFDVDVRPRFVQFPQARPPTPSWPGSPPSWPGSPRADWGFYGSFGLSGCPNGRCPVSRQWAQPLPPPARERVIYRYRGRRP